MDGMYDSSSENSTTEKDLSTSDTVFRGGAGPASSPGAEPAGQSGTLRRSARVTEGWAGAMSMAVTSIESANRGSRPSRLLFEPTSRTAMRRGQPLPPWS